MQLLLSHLLIVDEYELCSTDSDYNYSCILSNYVISIMSVFLFMCYKHHRVFMFITNLLDRQ